MNCIWWLLFAYNIVVYENDYFNYNSPCFLFRSVNLEPAGKLTFTLTYEELLKRVNSKYEYILHVQPGQIIKDYRADIYINESLPLRSIHVPELKTNPNEITSQLKSSSIASIARDLENSPNRAHVSFKPDIQYQTLVAKNLVSTWIMEISHLF